MMFFRTLTLLLFTVASFTAEAKTVRILTIGNSFSRNATNHLDDLALAGGHTLIHTPLVIAGASFQVHADKAKKNQADPRDKAGLYTNGMGLKENLLAEPWDFVTIQQVSIKSHDFSTFQPDAGILRDLIAQHAPQAKLLIHQTWAYRVDDPRFSAKAPKAGEPRNQEEMYRGLTSAYDRIAAEFGAKVIPVGDAMFAADSDPEWGFKPDTAFNVKTARRPELPRQTHSLHVGWRWVKSKDGKKTTLGMDGHHANLAGEYLGACVWYEVLFGESAVGTSHIPKGMKAEDARFLQQTAHRVVQARLGGKKDAAEVIEPRTTRHLSIAPMFPPTLRPANPMFEP